MECHLDDILPVRYITCTQLTLFVGPAIQQTDRQTDRQTNRIMGLVLDSSCVYKNDARAP